MTAAHAQERLHAMDSVRALALLCGVLLHAMMSFLPGMTGWAASDVRPSPVMAWAIFVIHVFRMSTFFLIAGFFARMMLQRKGLKAFVGDRMKRVAAPLVVAWPILLAGIVAAFMWGGVVMHGDATARLPSIVTAPLASKPPGAFPFVHLWFLYFLLIYYALALGVRGCVEFADREGALRQRIDLLVRALMHSPVAPILLAAPLAVLLYLAPDWLMWFGVPTPDQNLVPDVTALLGYGLAFGLGWLLHRQRDLMALLERRWHLNLALTAGFVLACLALAGPLPNYAPQPAGLIKAAGAAAYAAAVWTSTFAVVGMAYRFLSGHSPVRRYLADASYWIYLVHLPLVMALQVAVSQLDWPAGLKLAVILGVAMPVMLLSYEFMVRYTVIGAVLNGPRRRGPHDHARPALSAAANGV